ncbi:hypothetical protein ABW20_dc0108806 [Dactylellina cionopaga]|nr:hypothetical protein ABW20_dc0108806 [Dactylellina cionopaga]
MSSPPLTNPTIPFSEPPYLMGLPTPYYKASHYAWQKHCRSFISSQFGDSVAFEASGEVPSSVWKAFAETNMLIPALPYPLPVKQLKEAGITEISPGGLKVDEFDAFHRLIYADEMLRMGLGGPPASITTGISFGIPPLYSYGSPALQKRWLGPLFRGEIRCCLAITEPDAGSDVANITTTAKKSSCGKYYIVTGQKKWITTGIWSEYATMAVRTGAPGSGPTGLSLLWVPLKVEGVEMRRIAISGGGTSGTTFIDLSEVKVPVENLIGVEGQGMKYIMNNFNTERLTISIGATRTARVALAAATEYVMKREAFGKPLVEQQVVRHRLAKAGVLLESQWAWVEQIVYQVGQLEKKVGDAELGGMTAMLKANSGMVLNECAQCAVLLFGGKGLTKGGEGETVENILREVVVTRIPGGSEDVLLDLGVRQLVKIFKAKTAMLDKTRAAKL